MGFWDFESLLDDSLWLGWITLLAARSEIYAVWMRTILSCQHRDWVLPVPSGNVTEAEDADVCILVCLQFWADYDMLSTPTIRCWWSHWIVTPAHHCYLWWRWWSWNLVTLLTTSLIVMLSMKCSCWVFSAISQILERCVIWRSGKYSPLNDFYGIICDKHFLLIIFWVYIQSDLLGIFLQLVAKCTFSHFNVSNVLW